MGDVLQKLKVASVSWKSPTGPCLFWDSYLLNCDKIKANLRFLTLQFCPRFHCRGIVHSSFTFLGQSSNLVSIFRDYNDITNRTTLADTNSGPVLFCTEANEHLDISSDELWQSFYICLRQLVAYNHIMNCVIILCFICD